MGYLHEGHLSLLRIAKQKADDLVLSIFVNPAQFGPTEDLSTYPRSLERDLELAEKEGVDAVFVPTDQALYQEGYQTYVELEKLPQHLCGLSRPVFFRGVTTVVTQLFNIVKPHIAVFGEKDFQQLAIIRQLVKDLKFDIEIIGGPIVREKDGLAMSSRNIRLTKEERKLAPFIYETLLIARQKMGSHTPEQLKEWVRLQFIEHPEMKLEYFEIVEDKGLDPVEKWDINVNKVACIAVQLGGVRLIDNMKFD